MDFVLPCSFYIVQTRTTYDMRTFGGIIRSIGTDVNFSLKSIHRQSGNISKDGECREARLLDDRNLFTMQEEYKFKTRIFKKRLCEYG